MRILSVLIACSIWPLITTAETPNVLMIVVDDMGYGDAACFNRDSKIQTPRINTLAAAGMRLTDAHAPGPLCHMSRYGLMTGRYPHRIDVSRWNQDALIEPGETTLPRVMQTAGYQTAMVGKWHVGFNERGVSESGYDRPMTGGPVDVGFDTFFGIRASTDIPPYFYISGRRAVRPPTQNIEANSTPGWSPIQGEFWRAGGIAPDLQLADVLPRLADEAIGVVDRWEGKQEKAKQGKQPLFLYVAFPAPHTPWLPPERFAGRSDAGMYGDFLMTVDEQVGRVIERFDAATAEPAMVVFTSDNGPVWYPKDAQRTGHDCAGGLRGMKGDAWEAGHRMPMIVRWADQIAAGSRSDQLVAFTDWLATLSELTGVKLPAGAGPDSQSFLPTLLTGQPSGRTRWVMKSARGSMVVRDGSWKWIDRPGSGGFSPNHQGGGRRGPNPATGETQLYDLSVDLSESNNLAEQHPDRVAAMRAILAAAK